MHLAPETILAERYRVLRELGAGGNATVYLADDLRHERRVAVKVLRPELASAVGPERFLEEIRTTARLRHPHILPLFDSGQWKGAPFYVMPVIEGESLRSRLETGGPLPLQEALRITRAVADALAHAHARGIVHRDIKPENILLDAGHAVVADFGIAKALDAADATRMTQEGMVVGTPSYLSPEQAAGEREIDGRADIYALACTCYEMLVGEPPFTGTNVLALLRSHLMTTPVALSARQPGLPVALSDVVSRALAKSPNERFADATAFAAALEGSMHPGAVAAAAPARGDRSLVVLPFTDLSPATDDSLFADGLTDEVITDLSRLRALTVISRSSAWRLRGSTEPLPAIATALGVRYVLEGSVRRAGDSLRVTARLVDAAADTTVWADKFQGTLDDVFAMQERISRVIADSLMVTLTPAESRGLTRTAIENPRVFECVLRARQELWSFTLAGAERAIQMAQEGLEQFGPHMRLYNLLIGAYAILPGGVGVWSAAHHAGLSAAAAAVEAIDPDAAETHYARGVLALLGGDRVTALRALRRSVERDPGNVDAMNWLSNVLIEVGRHEEALALVSRVAEVDPLTPMSHQMVGYCNGVRGRHAIALTALRKAADLSAGQPMMTWAYAQELAMAGQNEEALAVIARMTPAALSTPQGWAATLLAHMLRGEVDALRAAWSAPMMVAVRSQGYLSRDISAYYAGAGLHDEAMNLLTNAVDLGISDHVYLADVQPFLGSLRRDPRFSALLTRVEVIWRSLTPPRPTTAIPPSAEAP
jgi:eukaryotic-like serine/threonine-protein kinase